MAQATTIKLRIGNRAQCIAMTASGASKMNARIGEFGTAA
jgi:hypothetical protein